jgi:hypothetical protein
MGIFFFGKQAPKGLPDSIVFKIYSRFAWRRRKVCTRNGMKMIWDQSGGIESLAPIEKRFLSKVFIKQ